MTLPVLHVHIFDMLSSLSCVTYNVQSLCNANKWRLFWLYVHKMQPDILCLQEHNQHFLVGQQGYFGGYHIFYAGTGNFLGVCFLIKHDLQPELVFNDPHGRWMIIQCLINGDIYEIASLYASQTSACRARMWDSISRYPWRSNALICGDFNNSPLLQDNTTDRSHMIPMERHSWDAMLFSIQAHDLWMSSQTRALGYTYHHNAFSHYWARLDRWYLLKAMQYDDFISHVSISTLR